MIDDNNNNIVSCEEIYSDPPKWTGGGGWYRDTSSASHIMIRCGEWGEETHTGKIDHTLQTILRISVELLQNNNNNNNRCIEIETESTLQAPIQSLCISNCQG